MKDIVMLLLAVGAGFVTMFVALKKYGSDCMP